MASLFSTIAGKLFAVAAFPSFPTHIVMCGNELQHEGIEQDFLSSTNSGSRTERAATDFPIRMPVMVIAIMCP